MTSPRPGIPFVVASICFFCTVFVCCLLCTLRHPGPICWDRECWGRMASMVVLLGRRWMMALFTAFCFLWALSTLKVGCFGRTEKKGRCVMFRSVYLQWMMKWAGREGVFRENIWLFSLSFSYCARIGCYASESCWEMKFSMRCDDQDRE